MKIVYYLPSLYISGGLERIITFKANYFAEHLKDSEVYIITSEQNNNEPYFKVSPQIKLIDINVLIDTPINQNKLLKLLKYPFKYLLFKSRFKRIIKEINPDILISTLRRELNFISSIDKKIVKIGEFHISRFSYHSYSIKTTSLIVGYIKSYFEKRFIRNINSLDSLVLLTEEEKTFWPEINNIEVIHNPLTINPVTKSDCNNKKVIAVGRYAHQKGFDMLIEAWKIVADLHPEWVLTIYGEGDDETLKRLIDKYNLHNSCLLKPATQEIVNKYCESSIFILSSRYEGFGLVITEAMACGVPPIAFDCPCGPKDIINNFKDGILVKSEDINELADKICFLIENENIRKEMGIKARKSSERFKIEHITMQWESLFEKLVKNKTINKD